MMKKLIGILFCFFIISLSFGQALKMKATSFAYKIKINDYLWDNWSSWQPSNVLIAVFDTDRFVIYSEKVQIYDAIKNEGNTIDSDGDETLSILCIDNEGNRCRIRLVILNSENGRMQIYVDYNDAKWVYNVYLLD